MEQSGHRSSLRTPSPTLRRQSQSVSSESVRNIRDDNVSADSADATDSEEEDNTTYWDQTD